ncbi:MAG: hypothetical protein P1U68_01785 [Verrucomicrobiales bacterium]|nr:hypothetical protein [Verrucomicrobiales bacterium]
MNILPTRDRRPFQHGFSLAEVTISIGIVSAILLPIIGLLATGTQLATVSQDQQTSSRIADLVSESIKAEGGIHLILLGEHSSGFPLDSSGQETLLTFSTDGEFLREVTPSDYSSGVQDDEKAAYLVSASLTPVIPVSGSIPRSVPILQVEIEVQHPAVTAEDDRTGQRFTSRVVAP